MVFALAGDSTMTRGLGIGGDNTLLIAGANVNPSAHRTGARRVPSAIGRVARPLP